MASLQTMSRSFCRELHLVGVIFQRKQKRSLKASFFVCARQDLNLRPSGPKPDALIQLSYGHIISRMFIDYASHFILSQGLGSFWLRWYKTSIFHYIFGYCLYCSVSVYNLM